MAGGEDQREQIVADVVVERGVDRLGKIGFADRMLRVEFDGELGMLGAACVRWRSTSSARRFADVVSQAAGLSGTPSAGQCSSAATSASCAHSSARPRSRVSRATLATTRADSICQIAASVSATAPAAAVIARD